MSSLLKFQQTAHYQNLIYFAFTRFLRRNHAGLLEKPGSHALSGASLHRY